MGDKRNVRSANKGNAGTKPSGQLSIINSDNAFILALCIIIPFLIYNYSAFHNQFTNWDDNKYVAENQYIRVWSLNLFTATVNANWAPVYTFLLAIEYHLFGMNAIGYHATSLLLHLINIVLVLGVILKLSRKKVVAGIVALVFASHPMHVESVSWIS